MTRHLTNLKRSWPVLSRLAILLLAICTVGTVRVRAQPVQPQSGQDSKDEQLLAALASTDGREANQAVHEIMRRGERMIPLLMRLRGDKRFFYGYGIYNPDSAWNGTSIPVAGDNPDEGRLATVEVAAIYLISAIYYGTTEFAASIYLSDGTPVKNDSFNTPERVAAAWASVEQWGKELEQKGLKKLQREDLAPLHYSKLHFW